MNTFLTAFFLLAMSVAMALAPSEALPATESTGSPLLDRALSGDAPRSLLPFWHDYPWRQVPEATAWTKHTYETLKTQGRRLVATVPADVAWYCPQYPNLNEDERLVFWTRFISVLAELESTYNPAALTPTPQVGPNVYSTGLLMLSLESAKASVFGCSMIQEQADLTDWRKNLTCGVRMLDFFMGQQGVISWYGEDKSAWKGLARYWEPLRDGRLKDEQGRRGLRDLIEDRRPLWEVEGDASVHPARRDSEYRRQNERKIERFMRLMNQMSFCQ